MNKLPFIERDSVGTGLTGECAYLWAVFLANEADMADDQIAYSKWQAIVETLQPKDGKAIPASVHYPDLEDAIKGYASSAYVYPGSDPQE